MKTRPAQRALRERAMYFSTLVVRVGAGDSDFVDLQRKTTVQSALCSQAADLIEQGSSRTKQTRRDPLSRRGHGAGGAAIRSRRRSLLSMTIAALVCATADVRPAYAQSITGTGDVNPGPIQTPNWVVGGEIYVGDTGNTGTLNIMDGATASSGSGAIGYTAGSGTVTVSGSDSNGNASSWTNAGDLNVAPGGMGWLFILDGGLVSNAWGIIGSSGGTGMVTVSGVDSHGNASTWSNSSPLVIGDSGTGTLLIDGGGLVRSDQGIIAQDNGDGPATGTVTVSGNDGNGRASTWNSGNIYVGFSGSSAGTLNILDGAMVTSTMPGGGAASGYIGYLSGSTGKVTVSSNTGNVSTWTLSDSILVGSDGDGTLTIERGGIVHSGRTYIASSAGSSGMLNLNGDGNGRGVLETGVVIGGNGSAIFNLNGGILRATRDEGDFLRGFGTLSAGSEGIWVDTNAHEVGIGTVFTGASSFNKLGLGTLTLTGDSSTFTGNAEIQAGTLQVDGVLGGPTNVWAGARLAGTGQVGRTSNLGVVAPGHSDSFGTLTVAGDYIASGGGLEIKTRLGDDSSPTDRLVVAGATSGATPVTVINLGGLGARTENGIQVVQVNGASSGRFTLANGNYAIGGQPALVAGAYGYVLEQNQADGDWYLHSSLLAVHTPVAPGKDAPLYQPGAPVYEAYARTLLALSELSSLRQRVGNRRWDPSGMEGDGLWLRVEGALDHLEPETSTSMLQQDIHRWKAQLGVDRLLHETADGARLVAGVNAQFGTASTEVSSIYGDGAIDTRSYGLGATLTWYGRNGAYVDAQAQANWFTSDLSSTKVGREADATAGYGYGLSLETGRSFPISNALALTPQMQLSYAATDFQSFRDRFRVRVDSNRGDSLRGRLGLALDHQVSWRDVAGRAGNASLYGLVDLRHEFLDGTRVRVADTPFDNRQERTWGGLAAGGDYSWNDGQYALYGEVRADTGLNEFGQSYTMNGTVGFRMRF